MGKSDVLTVMGTGDGNKDLTLVNAKFADGSTEKKDIASGNFSFDVYATGTGAVQVKFS